MKTTLRILTLAALLPFLFISQSCEEIKDEINKIAAFDATIDLPSETIYIDSTDFKSADGVNEDWRILKQYDVDVDLQKILDDNDLSSADFSSGKFKEADVTITSPAGVNLDFCTRMYIAISLNPNFSPEVKVAETDELPSANTASFNILPVDITEYIKAEVFWVRIYGDKKGPLPVNTATLVVDSKLAIHVEPL